MDAAAVGRQHISMTASSAHQWLDGVYHNPDKDNPYISEGITAHKLADLFLKHYTGRVSQSQFSEQYTKLKEKPSYSQLMDDHIQQYISYVKASIYHAKKRFDRVEVLLEERLDYSLWVPGGSGIADVVIVTDGIMEVIDLKYGQGTNVSAEDNAQLRLYALGAGKRFDLEFDIDSVALTIYQPRLGRVETVKTTIPALITWANESVVPKASYVYRYGARVVNTKADTQAVPEEVRQLVQLGIDGKSLKELTGVELGKLLTYSEGVRRWAETVKEYANKQAVDNDMNIDGWKLVHGKRGRTYTDDKQVIDRLKERYDVDDIAPRKPLGVGAMERYLGTAFDAELSGMIKHGKGKPTLAPRSDPRTEIRGDGSFAGFKH